VQLDECLPAELRGTGTTIARVSAGLSGAGVYRVDAGGRAYVLKVSDPAEPAAEWRRRRRVQQHAAEAGVAPEVVHMDEARRAVLSAFVVDRSFPRYYRDPRTHDEALAALGETLRRAHAIPLDDGAEARDPREVIAAVWSGFDDAFRRPPFVGDMVRRVLTEAPPARDREPVLSHNDVNPSNLVYDGERILLLDWDVAAPNDPYYDLAAASIFLRMDAETSRRLLEAHDGAPVRTLPPRFSYNQRLVSVLAGTMFLRLARQLGHAGATGEETIASTMDLTGFYQQLMAGTLSVATAEGQWCFGLALIKAGLSA
jgi:aminoglycoside phosphotransferase (APT) family kinase protein